MKKSVYLYSNEKVFKDIYVFTAIDIEGKNVRLSGCQKCFV